MITENKILAALVLTFLLVACAQVNLTPSPGFSELNIVYFTKDIATGLLSPQSIQNATGAEVVSDWQDVMEAIDHEHLDALIIHESALQGVDSQELVSLYDHGTVIAFFNVLPPAVEELIGDHSIGSNDWMDGTAEPMSGDFYLIVWHLTLCKDRQIAERGNKPLCPDSLVAAPQAKAPTCLEVRPSL